MANCPNCGSEHIYAKNETNVNWGYTAATWTLFRVVTTESKEVNACFDCGTSWRAAALYNTLQVIEKLTGKILNLAREEDRRYMNSFMSEVGPCIDSFSRVEKKTKQMIAVGKENLSQYSIFGCGTGCFIPLVCCFILHIAFSSIGFLLMFFVLPLMSLGIGMFLDSLNSTSAQQELEKTEREVKRMKNEAEKNLELKVRQFMKKHSL